MVSFILVTETVTETKYSANLVYIYFCTGVKINTT